MTILHDGFSTTVNIGGITLIEEQAVSPSGMSGGGPTSTTTASNSVWRTFKPKYLLTMKEMGLVVQYDPGLYAEVAAQMNVNQAISVTFPDGQILTFWGWLDDFQVNEVVEGELPTANLIIFVSNVSDLGLESGPVLS